VRLPIAARLPPLSCWLVQQRGINDGKRGAQPVIEGYLLVPATPLVAGLREILAQSRPCVAEDRFFHVWPVK
jgi:hypothetical protein